MVRLVKWCSVDSIVRFGMIGYGMLGYSGIGYGRVWYVGGLGFGGLEFGVKCFTIGIGIFNFAKALALVGGGLVHIGGWVVYVYIR